MFTSNMSSCRETEKEKMGNQEGKEESNNFVLKITFVAKSLS